MGCGERFPWFRVQHPHICVPYFSRFRVSFNLILLGAFLAFTSLGAGSGKQTQKPLGAHQKRISIAK
jgi:hypothetical protein